MPGNLPAQFLGGDGAVRLPTYPVIKNNISRYHCERGWNLLNYARGILLAPVVLGILAPLFLKLQMYWASENTYHILSAICHQASSRSFWIAGAPMGICARDVGLYIGIFGVSFSNILNRKLLDKVLISAILIVPIIIEKIFISDSIITNVTRFIVGMLTGFGIGVIFLSGTKTLLKLLKSYFNKFYSQEEVKT